MSNRHYYEGLMELIGFIFHMAAHGREREREREREL